MQSKELVRVCLKNLNLWLDFNVHEFHLEGVEFVVVMFYKAFGDL
jgi:hypothetical protein